MIVQDLSSGDYEVVPYVFPQEPRASEYVSQYGNLRYKLRKQNPFGGR